MRLHKRFISYLTQRRRSKGRNRGPRRLPGPLRGEWLAVEMGILIQKNKTPWHPVRLILVSLSR